MKKASSADSVASDAPAGKSERTRMVLIHSAEKLFGDFGIDAVGLRAISQAAHQKNNNAVQYHFGNKLGLLAAIFELREGQLQPQRQAMIEQADAQGRLNDLRWILRICFEPNFRLYRDLHQISYLKLHAAYLATHRPRGVLHPIDYESPNSASYRAAIELLRKRLSFLGERRLWLRLEAVGTMFLNTFIQHAGRRDELNLPIDELFDDTIEMMAAAITAPPNVAM
ncbi:TetR/AcrR family transcriptional regulator [Hydrocarboniphaga sp.]|uniref:TetR/AcrR family transcriptional regulator n=1 Tax=Hydrocarboniphaga sp. TaxID=2033016 RepID=UPI003D0A5774